MDESKGKIIDLHKIIDPRGNLTFVEECRDVPFNVSRVYWVYDVPAGESRGGHSHKHCKELLIAISGSFTVSLDDGKTLDKILLNHPYQGLLVDKGIWRTLEDFSVGSVCLVLAEDDYDEADYIYDYNEFTQRTECLK